jgi:hypothetical protein
MEKYLILNIFPHKFQFRFFNSRKLQYFKVKATTKKYKS